MRKVFKRQSYQRSSFVDLSIPLDAMKNTPRCLALLLTNLRTFHGTFEV